ncbi:pentapeptide repeat-containing protein [Eisenibacter elegans]|uniref:pentapeptide repeat-containing protein n=1 Tax=Eisenibacter elegans TaxID=997 RepID=UPI0004059CA7|nr:pentapeptide repeat-containing protein [Eisenibacter elegans]
MHKDLRKVNEAMLRKAANAQPILLPEWETILAKHHAFLRTQGGGSWQTLRANLFRIVGIYTAPNTPIHSTYGAQADVSQRSLARLSLQWVNFAYANAAGIYAEEQNWYKASLRGTLMIDSLLNYASFEEANLKNADFSRSKMMGCNFSGADLEDTDFENCDLRGANFSGARIVRDKTSFKNAILDFPEEDLYPPTPRPD